MFFLKCRLHKCKGMASRLDLFCKSRSKKLRYCYEIKIKSANNWEFSSIGCMNCIQHPKVYFLTAKKNLCKRDLAENLNRTLNWCFVTCVRTHGENGETKFDDRRPAKELGYVRHLNFHSKAIFVLARKKYLLWWARNACQNGARHDIRSVCQ